MKGDKKRGTVVPTVNLGGHRRPTHFPTGSFAAWKNPADSLEYSYAPRRIALSLRGSLALVDQRGDRMHQLRPVDRLGEIFVAPHFDTRFALPFHGIRG